MPALATADPLPKTGGDHPTVTVTVQGYGDSFESAKKDAGRRAVEQVVGQVIVSDREVSGSTVTKDVIGSYSAGYIDRRQVIESHRLDDGRYAVTMTVDVASSRIANRMMARGDSQQMVDGDRLQVQMESEFERRNQGDALIAQVLNNYPHNAFLINSGQTEFAISDRRAPQANMSFWIEMNPAWVTAFKEAAGLVSVKNGTCNSWVKNLVNSMTNKIKDQTECGKTPDLRVGSNDYYFYDQQTLRMINSELRPSMGTQRIGLHVDILDAGGNIIDQRCANINTETFIRYNQPQGVVNYNDSDMIMRPEIFGDAKIPTKLNVNLTNIRDLGEIAKIKLNIQNTCT